MSLNLPKLLYGVIASMSIGTSINGVGGRGFRVTGRGRAGGNLTTDIGEGQVEMVLVGPERVEYDTD